MYADDTTLFTTIQLSNTCPTKDVEYHLHSDLNNLNQLLLKIVEQISVSLPTVFNLSLEEGVVSL